jgi:hypothetical protein
MKKLIILSVSLLFLFACANKKIIDSVISTAEIDHVVLKREGCRFSSFFISIEFHNQYASRTKLTFTPLNDPCINDSIYSNLNWKLDNRWVPIVVSPNDSIVVLEPFESRTIRFKALLNIRGASLKQIQEFYKTSLSKPIEIIQSDSSFLLSLSSSSNFKIVLKLDDAIVNQKDSVSYNMTSIPPSSFDELPNKP